MAVLLVLVALAGTYLSTDILLHLGVNPGMVPLTGIAALLLAGYFIRKKMTGWAFIMTGLTIFVTVATAFLILYPAVMVSSIDPAYNLTIYNAASSAYTLRVMTVVALLFVPVVLLYQGWSFWVFRGRITEESALEY